MKRKRTLFSLVAVLLSSFVTLLGAEWMVRLYESYFTAQTNRSFLDYHDTWRDYRQGVGPGGYLKENFKGYVTDGMGGLVYWENNSQGFRSTREFSIQPATGAVRILSLGDSFTAGYRVNQDQNFSYLLESRLNQLDQFQQRVEVMISCIEDPPTGLYYLTRYGVHFHPHIVLFGVSLGNDITESYLRIDQRGEFILDFDGNELRIERKDNPQTETLWAELETSLLPDSSYLKDHVNQPLVVQPTNNDPIRLVSRIKQLIHPLRFVHQPQPITCGIQLKHPPLFDLSSGFGYYLRNPPKLIQQCYERFFYVLSGLNRFCKENNITLVVSIHPQRFQVQPLDWKETVNHYGLIEQEFDLMSPNKRINEFCEQHRILLLDPTRYLSEKYRDRNMKQSLYLPYGDMHWNALGHQIYAEFLSDNFSSILTNGTF